MPDRHNIQQPTDFLVLGVNRWHDVILLVMSLNAGGSVCAYLFE